ncbi:MAG TPA: cation:proton antiporter [Actinomycetota bacterium]|nr:cation:proton antiporter [Actinomycetota bacterium]
MATPATDLISTIAVALIAAFVAGYLARLIGVPSIVGYLLAGVVVGPFTPGLVADQHAATELAEIGVALLMFGVGLHFSFADLARVRAVAVPGALGQIAVAVALGTVAGVAFGWSVRSAIVLGLAISVASTVVLVRALRRRELVDTEPGRVAIGWLIVEDLFTVVALLLLPVLSSAAGATPLRIIGDVATAIGKVSVLIALMVVVGSRFLPWLLARVHDDGSRELFTLAVLATAVGIAWTSAVVFDVSLALGAFLAGAVLSGSSVSERATADITSLTDVFTVLFFVSVGMLLDPKVLTTHPVEILVVLAIVVVGKSLAALGIVRALGRPRAVGRIVAAGLAQIGEFSFIVATAGRSLGLLTDEAFHVIVAVALFSITANPPLVAWADRSTRLPATA